MSHQSLRPMSVHEGSFPVFADMAPGGGNIVSALEMNAGFTEADLAKVCLQLERRHPLFAAGYKDKNHGQGKPDFWFNAYPAPPLNIEWRQASKESYADQVDIARSQLLNHHFLHGQRLCRLIAVKQQSDKADESDVSDKFDEPRPLTLFFCISHAVCDGSGTLTLMQEWVKLMDARLSGKEVSELSLPKPLEPALWASMPKKIAGFFGAFRSLGILRTMINAQKQADKGFSFAIETPAPAAEHRCIATRAVIEPDDFKRLRQVVKDQHSNLHGVISAGLIYAFMDYLKRQPHQPEWFFDTELINLPLVTTVNVRDKVEPALDAGSVSCQSSGITTNVSLNTNYLRKELHPAADYWGVAQQVADEIPRVLKADQHWKILRIYQLAGLKGLKKMFADSAEIPLSTPISFANLNRFSFAPSEHITITRTEMQPAFHALGSGMNVTVNSFEDRLTLCITCAYPMSSKETLKQYAEDVVKHLLAVSGSN